MRKVFVITDPVGDKVACSTLQDVMRVFGTLKIDYDTAVKVTDEFYKLLSKTFEKTNPKIFELKKEFDGYTLEAVPLVANGKWIKIPVKRDF